MLLNSCESKEERQQDEMASSDEKAPNDDGGDMSEHTLSQTRSRASQTRALDKIRSQNGYGVDDDSEPTPNDGGEAQKETAPGESKDPYEVGWDGGDNDPLCPRSFSKGRKWLITIIVSHVSLCV